MVMLDLLGRRTALRILWELRNGPLTFRALQAAADTSPGVLNTRLKELRAVEIVTLEENGYVCTPRGKELMALLAPLQSWADDWSESLS